MQVNVEFELKSNAPAAKLWDIIVDAAKWPEWQGTNCVKLAVPGRITKGSRFFAKLAGLMWELEVISSEEPHKISWIGKRPGLRGIHEWEFKQDNGKTIAITRETITGWLLPLAYPVVKNILFSTDKKWLSDLVARAETS